MWNWPARRFERINKISVALMPLSARTYYVCTCKNCNALSLASGKCKSGSAKAGTSIEVRADRYPQPPPPIMFWQFMGQ